MDFRMLPFALVAWASSWCMQEYFDSNMSPSAAARTAKARGEAVQAPSLIDLWALALAGLVAVGALVFCYQIVKRSGEGYRKFSARHCFWLRRLRIWLPYWGPYVLAMLCLALATATAACSTSLIQESDTATRLAAAGTPSDSANVRVLTPMMASERRGYACRVDVRIDSISALGVLAPSSARARLHAARSDCVFVQGGCYQVQAKVSFATFGASSLWLTLPQSKPSVSAGTHHSSVRLLRQPNWLSATIGNMQTSFLQVTRALSDQGRVLVPGLTLGVMGQESFVAEHGAGSQAESGGIDPAYATTMKDDFKRAGIMHLMAVSGSHFLLIGSCLRCLLNAVRAPKWAHAGVLTLSFCALAQAMYPSDSVLRAQVMGIGAALVSVSGRKSQSVSVLSWTTLAVLLFSPAMARSFGFALSCAAVLGITMGSALLSARLERYMPTMLAQPLAMTLLAQGATLPIQVLMSAQLPVLSPLANLLVSPFVDIATIFGLCALSIAWLFPPVALLLAQVASWGTQVMFLVASWMGGSSASVLPWPAGIFGACAVLVIELAAVAWVCALRWWSQWSRLQKDPAFAGQDDLVLLAGGEPYTKTLWHRIRLWWQESWSLVTSAPSRYSKLG
ncbi:ComEC/Rec2 family competence protein [Bombiscardovia apis]|uniref:ComEC/Rec2 family competence protein n=1 Tax=Bombiscardovia apis TaxID=2932182 RepID=UPI0029545D84|nr:ComEC/Rec2 family competence protein [Bombiscardovia apis]